MMGLKHSTDRNKIKIVNYLSTKYKGNPNLQVKGKIIIGKSDLYI